MLQRSPASAAALAALVTVLLWSGSYPAIRMALRDLEPLTLAAARFAVASLVMLAWMLWRRPRLPAWRETPQWLIAAAISGPLYHWFLNNGEVTVSAGAASFLVSTAPVITLMVTFLMGQEQPLPRAWAGTAVSTVGVGLIAATEPGGLHFGSGAVLVMGAALCQAFSPLVQQNIMRRHGPMLSGALVVLLGTLMLLPWMHDAWLQFRQASWQVQVAVLYLGVFPTAVGYLTWNAVLAQYGAARASNLLYLIPPGATALGLVTVGEWPALITLAGGTLAIAGVVLVNTRTRRRPQSAR